MSHTLTNSDIAALVAEKMKDAQDAFGVYFRQNYPGPDTVIHDPDWHAPRIFRAATHRLKALIESQAAELATLQAGRDVLKAAGQSVWHQWVMPEYTGRYAELGRRITALGEALEGGA